MPVARAQAAPLDVRVLVDVSESMVQRDPEAVRSGALRLLLEMLPDDARAGIWSYSDTPRVLINHGRVNQLWRTQAALRVNALPSGGSGSDLHAAIEELTSISNPAAGENQHLFVITATASEPSLSQSQLNRSLSRLRASGYRLSVLALPGGQGSEDSALQALAVQTGGRYLRVADFGSIEFALAAYADAILPLERLPLDGDQGFIVEQGLAQMTLLRLRRSGDDALILTDPGGVEYSRLTPNVGLRWQVGDNYDLVTFQQPVGGRWYLSGDSTATIVLVRGGVIPRVVGLPAMIFPGELKTFDLKVDSAAGAISDRGFLDLLKIQADVLSSTERTVVPVVRTPEGGYQLQLLADQGQGEYQLQIRITGPTFERLTTVPFSIRNPISLRLMPDSGPGSIWFTMTSVDVMPQQMQVTAMATRPMLGAEPLEVTQFPGGLWKIALAGPPGLVELTLDIEGKRLNGNTFSIQTKPLVITQPIISGKYHSFDIHGTEVSNHLILESETTATVAPVVQPPAVQSPAEAGDLEAVFELPLWFVAALAPVNLLVGFAVFFLLAPVAAPERFLGELTRLQELLAQNRESEAASAPG